MKINIDEYIEIEKKNLEKFKKAYLNGQLDDPDNFPEFLDQQEWLGEFVLWNEC